MALLLVLPVFTATAAPQKFFAEQEAYGDVRVVNETGVEVPTVNGDPIGTRPDTCPAGSYYFNELESDKAQLVLTDCATDQGNYPVEVIN